MAKSQSSRPGPSPPSGVPDSCTKKGLAVEVPTGDGSVTGQEADLERLLGSDSRPSGVLKEESRASDKSFARQTHTDFLGKDLPSKENLIEGIFYRRDLVAVLGRRREGKTTLVCNLALAGALGHQDFLGHKISRPFRTTAFYLEDDETELQEKLRRMSQGAGTERFDLYTLADFYEAGVEVNVVSPKFQEFVRNACEAGRPDVIMFDNLAHLLRGDYNNSKRVHELMAFCYKLRKEFDAAILIAAHPRKQSQLNNSPTGGRHKVSLFEQPELFFEECMGSSHFINSTGSLWGLERDRKTETTRILLGAQRHTGQDTRTIARKDDDDWLVVSYEDVEIAEAVVLTTEKRRKVWNSLPEGRSFSQVEARKVANNYLKSNGSFQPFWTDLLRTGLLIPDGADFRKRSK